MDEVGWTSDTKYKYYLFQNNTSFCNTTTYLALEQAIAQAFNQVSLQGSGQVKCGEVIMEIKLQ
jgi:hypothetical protein